jgi:hypothetical protein
MKTIISFVAFCLIISLMFIGCGKSDEQIKRIAVLETELSQLQMRHMAQLDKLNKIAWQIDSISKRKDQTVVEMATELHATQELVTIAFKAIEDTAMRATFQMTLDELPKALEVNISGVKRMIERASAAIDKSNEVIAAINKKDAQRNIRNK